MTPQQLEYMRRGEEFDTSYQNNNPTERAYRVKLRDMVLDPMWRAFTQPERNEIVDDLDRREWLNT